MNDTSMDKKIIFDLKKGNILSENSNDTVILRGEFEGDKSTYVKNLELILDSGDGSISIIKKLDYGLYYPELFLGDFNGDKRDNIMVRGEYGGSGGYEAAYIYEYTDGEIEEIFNPNMFSEKYKMIAEYLDDYKLEVNVPAMQKKFLFDISDNTKEVLNIIYDKDGKVKINEDDKPIVLAIGDAFPIKFPFKDNYYLFLRQRVIGVSNANTVGYMESFVDLLDDDISVDNMGAYNFGINSDQSRYSKSEKNIMENLPKGSVYISPRSLEIEQDILEFDFDNDGKNEYLIPYKLDGEEYLSILEKKKGHYLILDIFKVPGGEISNLYIKCINGEYYIFLGTNVFKNKNQLQILKYRNGHIRKVFNGKNYYYNKIFFENLNDDGIEEMILWLQDTGEAYKISIFTIEPKQIKETSKYDKIYYNHVVKYYKNLVKKYKGSSTYLYYLGLALEKVGDYKKALEYIKSALDKKYPYPSIKELKKIRDRLVKKINGMKDKNCKC